MAEKISGYTADAISNPIKDEDLLDFSNEDGGGGFDVSKKIKVSQLLSFLNAVVNNLYNADGTLLTDREVTSLTFYTRFNGGDVIVKTIDEISDYAFKVQDSGGAERGRLGMNTTTGSGEISLNTISGEWLNANDGTVKVNLIEFVVDGINNRVGIGLSNPSFKLDVLTSGNDGMNLSNGVGNFQVLPNKSSFTHFQTSSLGYHFNFGAGGRHLRMDSDVAANILMYLGGSATGFDLGGGSGTIVHSFITEGANIGKVILNNVSAPTGDVQIKGDTDVNLFYSDASADAVGFGGSTPQEKVHSFAKVRADTGFSFNGNDGITEVLTFGGGGTGDVASLTVEGGIITGRTLVP